MKRKLILFAAAAALTMSAYAQDYATLGVINGRAWNDLSADTKLGYISGVRDGLEMAGDKDKALEIYRVRANNGEVIQMLDSFFADPANANVPVALSLGYLHAKMEGATPQALAEFAATLRRIASGNFKQSTSQSTSPQRQSM